MKFNVIEFTQVLISLQISLMEFIAQNCNLKIQDALDF